MKTQPAKTSKPLEINLEYLLDAAMAQAKEDGTRGAARILAECWTACEEHIDKPIEFDEIINALLDGPDTPEGHNFKRLPAVRNSIQMEAKRLIDIRDGKTRSPETEVAHDMINIDAIKAALYTDVANARRLYGYFGKELRHVTGFGWREFDGARWQLNDKGAHQRAQYIGTVIKDEFAASGSRDPLHAKAAYSWARRSEYSNTIDAMLRVAEKNEMNGDSISWDSDKWALNTQTGTIDLRTGKWRPHRREDYLTTLSPTKYNPDAAAPRFEQFLAQVFAGDEALMRYLQWAVGYSLTGDTSAQVLFLLHGQGANGKSTLLDALRHVLGPDYFHVLTFEDLLQHKQPRHLSTLAQVRGKRLVMASEVEPGRKLNAGLIKSLTGGDPIRANFMRQDAFEFVPVCKPWLLCNHKPTVSDNSLGLWRRVRLLPFLQSFTGDKADPRLAEALKGEAEGILAWAVRGAMRHAEHGEPALPDCVRAATDAYRLESDTVAQFLAECCKPWENATQPKRELFDGYSKWANGRGMNRQAFTNAMREHGYTESRIPGIGREAWKGLRLTTQFGDDCEVV